MPCQSLCTPSTNTFAASTGKLNQCQTVACEGSITVSFTRPAPSCTSPTTVSCTPNTTPVPTFCTVEHAPKPNSETNEMTSANPNNFTFIMLFHPLSERNSSKIRVS